MASPTLRAPNFYGHPSNVERSLLPMIQVAEGVYGLKVTDTTDHSTTTSSGGTSYHVSGKAVDLSGSPAAMNAFAKWVQDNFSTGVLELIHNGGGAGYAMKNGKKVNGASFYASGGVWGQHKDHVHLALSPDFKLDPAAIVNGGLPDESLGQSIVDQVPGLDAAGQLLAAFKWVFSGAGLLTIALVAGGGAMAVTGFARMFGVRAPVAAAVKLAAKGAL